MSSDSEIKITVLGESSVGKTNLINVATGGTFSAETFTSSNGSYKEGSYTANNGKIYSFHLWDTVGQEKYRSLNKIFIQDSKIIIFVYAINDESSFKELNYWIDLVKNNLGEEGYVAGILANKNDLYENQVVKDEDGKNYAKSKGYKFKVTSALCEPIGFKCFLEELIEDYIKIANPIGKDSDNKNDKNTFTLWPWRSNEKNKNKKKECC